MSAEDQNQPEQQPGGVDQFLSGRGPLVILAGLIVVSLIGMCVLGFFLLRTVIGDSAETAGDPTPFSTSPASGGVVVGGNEALVVGISGSETISVTLDAPVAMRLKDETFNVQPQSINADGSWSPGLDNDTTAGWVYGSIVNYIMALQDSGDNQALLDGLVPGDRILLDTQSGATYTFEFESRTAESVDNNDVFNQYMPGITLTLLGTGGDERLIVRGRYVVGESQSGSNGSLVEIGEPAQLVDLQVTVTNVSYVSDSPQTPPGFAFFLIDAEIVNTGNTAVDLNSLQLVLVDELGNQYALNPVAVQSSGSPPLNGVLNPGQAISGTVGYQVPAGLVTPSLKWVVAIPGTDAQIQVNIPYTGAVNPEDTVITLQGVTVSQDLSSLTLTGQITNRGTQPLVISSSDVYLRTPDGASYLMLNSNPAFPWTVEPNGTLIYSVTFQRPLESNTAIFNILYQPFELTNLQ